MNSITNLTAQQLRHAAELKQKILSLHNEISRLLGAPAQAAGGQIPKKRRMSAAGIARIRAGAKRRWARARAAKAMAARNPRRKMSAAARKRLSQMARARWAKAKAQGKKRL